MTSNYYFLGSLLPDLQIGIPPEIDFQQLSFLLDTNLTKADYERIRNARRYYDIQNIRSFWRGEPLSFRGNHDDVALEEALITQSALPSYVFDFIQKYDSTEDRLHHFASLLATYFKTEIEHSSGFLHDYLNFQRELRLTLTALRSKKLGRDIMVELQYEDLDDDLVRQIIAQKDAKEYEPPERFSELKPLFDEHGDSPLELHKALVEFQFHKVDELLGIDFFTINRILAYMVKLIFVEKWLELDKKKGMQLVDTIVKDAT
ncbi:MAG: DUF2764 family protein [Chlamydiota bacterium]